MTTQQTLAANFIHAVDANAHYIRSVNATNQNSFNEHEMNSYINELECDAFEYIQSQLESDHHLTNQDITYLDEKDIAEIVEDYMDLLD